MFEEGVPYDTKADVWSLGIVMSEISQGGYPDSQHRLPWGDKATVSDD